MMQTLLNMRSLGLLAAALICLGATPRVYAQAEQERGTFPAGANSENNEILERILARYPDADTNRDGILDADEGNAFIQEQRDNARERNNNRRNRGRLRPSVNDLRYGPEEKQHLDLYLAESDEPTPLVVFFHGGQFITGDESNTGTLNFRSLLNAGISVASVDYRDTNTAPFPAPFDDAARAVQYLRLVAETYNLDPARFAGHGEEAGGNLALYLALHDDLAQEPTEQTDPAVQDADESIENNLETWESPDLKTQSTRLSCAVARHPIASFDPRDWKKYDLPMNGHERLMQKYLDVRYLEPLDDDDVIALVEQVSPLQLVSPSDPEILLMSQYEDFELADDTTWTIMAHHPRQSKLIAAAMRTAGNRATVRYRGMENDPRTSSIDFFTQKLVR